MYPAYRFKVNMSSYAALPSYPQPDNNLSNIIEQLENSTVWIDGVDKPLKHGDIFTLSGNIATKVKAQYYDGTPRILDLYNVPDVLNLELSDQPGLVHIIWDSNNQFYTELEIYISDQWTKRNVEVNNGDVSLEVDPGTIDVRLRFTDGNGNYSDNYTYGSIDVGTYFCDEERETELPVIDDTGSVIGCLFNQATYNVGDGFVTLTEDVLEQHGEIGYIGDLPETFEANFDFRHRRVIGVGGAYADAVYFYFFANDRPVSENGNIQGYVIGFSEYYNRISVHYGTEDLDESEFIFPTWPSEPNTWRAAKIIFSNGQIWIYIDGSLQLTVVDNGFESRVFDENHRKFGFGARTGGSRAEHNIKNIIIEESSVPS